MFGFKLHLRGDAFRSVLGFTFSHWRYQPLRVIAVALLVLGSTLADVMTPYFAGQLVDAVANGAPGEAIAWNAAISAFWILIALGMATLVLRNLAFWVIIKLTLKMMREIASGAFYRVQRFSTDWHANSFAGSTVRKITRGMWALDVLNDTILVALFPSAIMLIGSSILLAVFWPLMGLLVALGSLLYVGMTFLFAVGIVAPAATNANAWDTRLGGALADAVSCNGVVKAFGAETREETRLNQVINKWSARTGRMWRLATLNGMAQNILLVLIRTVVVGTALLLWARGTASAGDIAFVLTSFLVLQGYLREVGQHIRNLQKSVNDMEELVNLHQQPLGIEDRPAAPPMAISAGAIGFENVTFHYASHAEPLYENFSVSIAGGERVGLVGPSGSGKTTFVKLIQRLYDVNAGRILIDGQDIALVQQKSLRAQIAIVQQEPILFHRTLADNIAYARPGASMDEVIAAARQASAHDFIMRLPKGYETLVGERGVKLSGGERQRVAIARAFLANSPILIFDEATSSLDSESEVEIQAAMERLMEGRTTLVIAHRLSTVRALDRLLVFDRGRIVEEGTHSQLSALPDGVYRRLFDRQVTELTKGLAAE